MITIQLPQATTALLTAQWINTSHCVCVCACVCVHICGDPCIVLIRRVEVEWVDSCVALCRGPPCSTRHYQYNCVCVFVCLYLYLEDVVLVMGGTLQDR